MARRNTLMLLLRSRRKKPLNKTARFVAWNRGLTEKLNIFGVLAPFKHGSLGVSTQTLSPGDFADVAPVTLGLLSP